MEKLADLPPAALVTFGAVLALIFGVRYLGLFQGQSVSRDKESGGAQVAAVIVDPTALKLATAAIEAQTFEMTNCRKSLERALESLCRSIDRLCEEVDDLKKEMIRKR